MHRICTPAVLLLCVIGCQSEEGPPPPEAVVEEFLRRMQRVQGEVQEGRAALELLNRDARENLAERASRASAAAGTNVEPSEMLVPARFSLAFEPRKFVSTVQGQWAVVSVYGPSPKTQIEEVRCVQEDGQWRIVIDMPPLRPIEKRRDDDTR